MTEKQASRTEDRLISLFFNVGRTIRQNTPKHDPFSLLKLETLRYVSEVNEPQMKDIATHLAITAPSATSLVNSLVRAGALKRIVDPKDRRSVHLALTGKAEALVKHGHRQLAENLGGCLEVLTIKEKENLIKIMEKILKPKI